jgi:hypothetical protein
MIVYGMAFDFFNISGSLFVEKEAPSNIRASAQGLFMFMTNGLGAYIGGKGSGYIVDYYTKTNEATKRWLNEYIIKPTWTFVYTQLIDLFADISYGYGITVHKSQGSGYNNVYVHVRDIISRNNNEKERTQCMYTGLSRASLQLTLLL